MRSVLVLHGLGDPRGGAPWADAFRAVGFDDVLAPDLPGHGAAAQPAGGNYGMADAAFAAGHVLASGVDLAQRVVVGVGQSGWSAQVLAVAGHAGSLVLVDGLGAPWRSTAERMERRRDRQRAILADPAAMAPHRGAGPDPRLAHRIDSHGDHALACRAAALVPVPTLLIEQSMHAVSAVVACFGVPVTVHESSQDPRTVGALVAAWVDQTTS